VTVVKDDGSEEIRDVTVGVTDRVNAQIISGLSEGERVVAGFETVAANTARPQPGRAGGIGVVPGAPRLGGFR
jgi:macrolide-specific efflux system membrane fusion protein